MNDESGRLERRFRQLKLRGRYNEGKRLALKAIQQGHRGEQLLMELAFFKYHLHDYQGAIRIYRGMITENKQMFNVINFLSRVYALKGDMRAKALAEANYLLYPTLMTSNTLANVYDMLDQNESAENQYKKTLKMARTPEEKFVILNNLAEFYFKIRETAKAVTCAKHALSYKSVVSKREYSSLVRILKKKLSQRKP